MKKNFILLFVALTLAVGCSALKSLKTTNYDPPGNKTTSDTTSLDFSKNIEKTIEAAEQGDVQAQGRLAFMYWKGVGVVQNYIEAHKWMNLTATRTKSAGLRKSSMRLRSRIEESMAPAQVAEAQQRAYEWKPKIKKSLPVAKQKFAEDYHSNYIKALKGDAEAQSILGFYNKSGLNQYGAMGAPNYVEAARWSRKAAEQGEASGQSQLGDLYSEGNGVDQDYVKAYKWYSMAAEQGEFFAQFYLGNLYNNGRGVEGDYVQAYKWYSIAIDRFHREKFLVLGEEIQEEVNKILEEVNKSRNDLENKITPAQVAEAKKLAREWKPKTWKELSQQN